MLSGLIVPFVASFVVGTADAAPIKATWTASSSAPTADTISYDVVNVGDAKASNVWVEGDNGSGLGSWVQADLGGEKSVTSFTVWAGAWYSAEYWNRYNRPKLLSVEFSDGSSQEFTLTDEYKPQTITLASPKATSTMKFKVKAIFNGNTFNDTAISEIVVRDGAPSKYVPVAAYKTSSTFPPDGDSYEAINTADGMLDSMWCEGNKKGDGTGEWIELDFGSSQSVSKLVLRNGNTTDAESFKAANSATAGTITFSDGTSENVTIAPFSIEQTLKFTPRTTSKVRLTFTTIKKGSTYDDLCISELYAAP